MKRRYRAIGSPTKAQQAHQDKQRANGCAACNLRKNRRPCGPVRVHHRTDDMDEGAFSMLWDGGTGEGGWIGWLRREVFGGLDETSREEVELIIQKPDGAA